MPHFRGGPLGTPLLQRPSRNDTNGHGRDVKGRERDRDVDTFSTLRRAHGRELVELRRPDHLANGKHDNEDDSAGKGLPDGESKNGDSRHKRADQQRVREGDLVLLKQPRRQWSDQRGDHRLDRENQLERRLRPECAHEVLRKRGVHVAKRHSHAAEHEGNGGQAPETLVPPNLPGSAHKTLRPRFEDAERPLAQWPVRQHLNVTEERGRNDGRSGEQRGQEDYHPHPGQVHTREVGAIRVMTANPVDHQCRCNDGRAQHDVEPRESELPVLQVGVSADPQCQHRDAKSSAQRAESACGKPRNPS
mmetsp:Transcript_25789/g.67592  ORF Transcript_25789/g.67592 Transcript_25789/m.67592 type:complete len:305 (+) Transcript_25789:219-1133(+)